jgi:hypothetical protein
MHVWKNYIVVKYKLNLEKKYLKVKIIYIYIIYKKIKQSYTFYVILYLLVTSKTDFKNILILTR